MRAIGRALQRFAPAVLASVLILTVSEPTYSQQPAAPDRAAGAMENSPQARGRAVLMRMAEFLGSAGAFSVSMRSGYDTVQPSGQKIEFGELRKITVSRPDRLRVESELSNDAKILTVFSGKEAMVVDFANNVYATEAQSGDLDNTIIHLVRDLHLRFPLAMLLVSRLPAEFNERVRQVDYVEKTNVLGIPTHHLAARSDTVDFQVWVADGSQPYPVRVVLTYKNEPGQPQFWAQLSDWNFAPTLAADTFVARPPDGAQKIAFAAQLPAASPAVRKASSSAQGAKK